MTSEILLRAVLGFLAAYHMGMGLLAFATPRGAARLAGFLYAIEASESPALRYGTRMLGLYALSLGVLLLVAARDPRAHVEIAAVVAGLQLARGVARIVFRRDLAAAFKIPARRNAMNAAILVLEALIIATAILTL